MEQNIQEIEHSKRLLQRQDLLQKEAQAVVKELDLVRLLSNAGTVRVHGSSVHGLMTWRDIDVGVSSPRLSIERVYEVMMSLLIHPRVKQVRYLNESGSFNATGLSRDERYFFMVFYDNGAESDWKIDISFWLDEGVRSEQIHNMIEQQLTPETRLIILRIKDVWWKQPSYRQEVSSVDIYDAVLQHRVRTLDEFDLYLVERGKPARIEM